MFVFVLCALAFATFHLVALMSRQIKPTRKKQVLTLAIVLNLSVLLYFKYANFFIENFNEFLYSLGCSEVSWTKVALPVGISFFTFQKLTYCIDVYRGLHAPLKRFRDFLLFALVFPQLIAGPIVRFTLIADELTNRKENAHMFLTGLFRFCIGLAKKVLIANVLGVHASGVFDNDLTLINSPEAWLAIVAYTFQIYFDFSGYSDMAIGLARMMGFHFPENFNNPYLSQSITEFWKRWHITLGAWMRDYLYIPLGGNKVKTSSRLYFNLVFVFLISGLWHGASWNFVFWGAFHGFFLVLDRIFLLRILEKSGAILSTLITFIVVLHGWIFFRTESMADAWTFIQKMYCIDGAGSWPDTTLHFKFILVFAVFLSLLVVTKPGKKLEQWTFDLDRDFRFGKYLSQTTLALGLFVICLAGITASGFNPFIYFRF